MNYKEIQEDVIKRYRITINENSKCRSRMHAHPKKRMVCKWHPKSSALATFELLHEIGHIENNTADMRRCEEEYYATVWAIERCKEYGVVIPEKIINDYQQYIWMERDRGVRRHGVNYPSKEELTLEGYTGRVRLI